VDAHGPPRDSETWDDFPFDGRRLLLRNFQVGGGLQIQPQLSGCLELVRQAHGRIAVIERRPLTIRLTQLRRIRVSRASRMRLMPSSFSSSRNNSAQ
jgi:hypothetical protein